MAQLMIVVNEPTGCFLSEGSVRRFSRKGSLLASSRDTPCSVER